MDWIKVHKGTFKRYVKDKNITRIMIKMNKEYNNYIDSTSYIDYEKEITINQILKFLESKERNIYLRDEGLFLFTNYDGESYFIIDEQFNDFKSLIKRKAIIERL